MPERRRPEVHRLEMRDEAAKLRAEAIEFIKERVIQRRIAVNPSPSAGNEKIDPMREKWPKPIAVDPSKSASNSPEK